MLRGGEAGHGVLGISNIQVSGFRSIRGTGDGLTLGPVNVVIGANGAGKSNLVALLEMLSHLADGQLGMWVTQHGGASAQLHYGPKTSQAMAVSVCLPVASGACSYAADLEYVANDVLTLASERLAFTSEAGAARGPWVYGTAHNETLLGTLPTAEGPDEMIGSAQAVIGRLSRTLVFHFHDTSATARVMGQWSTADCYGLKADGGNLGPVLLAMRDERPEHYRRVLSVIQQIAPFFHDFDLQPSPRRQLLLRWRERGSDMVFGAHQFSDGMLRFIMLTVLLLQPVETRPPVVVIDEPELGLHPAAIDALAAMVYRAAESDGTQVILTTQSPSLLDAFRAEDVIVATRAREAGAERYESLFSRLDASALEEWLSDYSLSELWGKNVLGGRPTA
jgi:predicted ATPase